MTYMLVIVRERVKKRSKKGSKIFKIVDIFQKNPNNVRFYPKTNIYFVHEMK